MTVLALFIFGRKKNPKTKAFTAKEVPVVPVDSNKILIEKEYQRVKPICAKRGHVFTPCITEMHKLYEKGYYWNTCRAISIPPDEPRPNLKLIDYPDRSELIKTEITTKLCYRCYEKITTKKDVVVETVWKNK